MNTKLHTAGAAIAVLLALAAPATLAVAPDTPPAIHREGEVLVKYRPGASAAEIQAVRGRLGMLAKRSLPRDSIELLALPGFTTTAGALAVLRADPAVEHAEPNFRRFARAVTPSDVHFPQQWGLNNSGQANFVAGGPAGTVGADLNMREAWDGDGNGIADRTGDASVVVAVIDDAFLTTHPDLAPNMVAGRNFIACQSAANVNPISSDGSHGTLVSGCIAARGNNVAGVAGVAWNVSLMPLKFGFDSATHLQALAFARDNGAKIINASFGGPGFSQLEKDTIAGLAANDILYVASAGNDDSNTDLAQLNYPANYDADNIVAVAATNRNDNIASFSQYGSTTVDVAAPGLQIVTTAVGNAYSTNPGVSGTSFSSPYTAGVAALLKSHVTPQPDFAEMKARLIESGSAVGGANPKLKTAGGRVDADLALDMADRPALVLTGVSFDDAANAALDPGETLTATFSVRNLWLGATNVMATLAVDDADITIDTVSPVAMGPIATLTTDEVDFQITVAGGITEHRYVTFTLTLTADGGYTATRSIGAEIGTLTDNTPITQAFVDGDVYDEFHAWHFDVPAGGGTRTLLITTSTANGVDVDLLVKQAVPPQYSITVGINPETTAGLFCTSGTTPTCLDPNTLLSARQDGVEAVTVENPPAGTYHLVVVNFVQQGISYVVEAELVNGDIRPDAFNFVNVTGIAPSTDAFSNDVLITGIDTASPVTVAGGAYSINGGAYVTTAGTIGANQTLRLRGNPGTAGFARVQVTVGGVTDTFFVNGLLPPTFGGGGEQSCGEFGIGSSGGGRVPTPALVVLMLAALARRFQRTA